MCVHYMNMYSVREYIATVHGTNANARGLATTAQGGGGVGLEHDTTGQLDIFQRFDIRPYTDCSLVEGKFM